MIKLKSGIIFITFFCLLLACKKGENSKREGAILKGAVFGTTYKIIYLNSAKNYQKSIDSLFYLVNKSMSTYIPTSDISRINRGDTTVVADAILSEVFKKSKRIFKETDGYFDPTIGNLVNAWGFGPKMEKGDLTDAQIKEQMQFVGLEKVALKKGKLVKQNPKIYLDFNSIAKGFGIDVIARFFNSKKIENYLIEIGGEIRAKGRKKSNKPWVIKLINPIKKDAKSGFENLQLSNKSMATSGDYRKFRIGKNGKKYVHILNPKTGYATPSDLLSVSVIASSDCADVDGYATAFMAMGLEKTKDFLKLHPNLQVILLFTNSQGILEEFNTYNNHYTK